MASSFSVSNSSANWSARNSQRRRYNCNDPVDKEKDCKFFEWINPPLPNKSYKDLMFDFYNQGNQAIDEDFEEFMEEEDAAEVVQEISIEHEGGTVARSWIWCLVV
ncbi:unnamed protein product [Lactuca saligna]|uniref:Zinc finger GRF-type domain-containing protein n=1 Tax=Lactuca saligna TaxID=75948 RepID=A0AA35YVT2_LACSI|nr:unnamed protein product [Lactuca saligna]